MKAINNYLIVDKHKEGPRKVGGLILTERIDEDNRYIKATVVSSGNLVEYIKEGDVIMSDKHAGHGVSLNDKLYQVIRDRDVVIVE